MPVVPLFGDMQISLISYVKKCPHYDPSRWSCAAENAEEKIGLTQYNLTGKIDQLQDEHLKFMCELSRAKNEVYILDMFNCCSILLHSFFVYTLLLQEAMGS